MDRVKGSKKLLEFSNTILLSLYVGFTGGSGAKNLPTNAGYVGSIPGLGRSPGKGNGKLFLYSYLGTPRDRRA